MDSGLENGLYDTPEFSQQTVFIPDGQNFKVFKACRLVVVKGSDRGRELTVKKERVTIGRSAGCDFVLSDPAVSHVHAELVTKPDSRVLKDLGSKNGILFMGHRVHEICVQPGTQVQIGNELVRVEALDVRLKIPLSVNDHYGMVLGKSVEMRQIFATLEKLTSSLSDLPVLLIGETGTGKGLLASALHANSTRERAPFVVMDCGAIPPNLIESIIFGHEKGAFTGAERSHRGLFEEANSGTLFLDEVGELILAVQPKMLRVLERQELRRIGGKDDLRIDVRTVAATNRDLHAMVEKGSFREDLLFRLSGIEMRIPPLRERHEDIFFLVERFLKEGNQLRQQLGWQPLRLDDDSKALLESYPWPGNVRELRNAIERACCLTEGELIRRKDLNLDLRFGDSQPLFASNLGVPYKFAKSRLIEQFERWYLANLLKAHGGNLAQAAKKAGLVRHHLRDLCHRYGIPCGSDIPGSEPY